MSHLETSQAALLGSIIVDISALASAGAEEVDRVKRSLDESRLDCTQIREEREEARSYGHARNLAYREAREERDHFKGRLRVAEEQLEKVGKELADATTGIHPNLRTARGRVTARGHEFFAVRFGRDVIRASRTVEDVVRAISELGSAEVVTDLAYCGPSVARTFVLDRHAPFSVVPDRRGAGLRMEF